jgi:hypothetical protein
MRPYYPSQYQEEEPAIPERPLIHVGCDVGQVSDASTIAVARLYSKDVGNKKRIWQRFKTLTATGPRSIDKPVEVPDLAVLYTFLMFSSVPLGTRYRTVAKLVLDVGCDTRFAGCDVHIFIDRTGHRPIYEELEDDLPRRRCPHPITLHPISFTGGDDYSPERGSLSKEYLASRLSLLFEQELIRFPKASREVGELKRQLAVYEKRKNERTGNTQYGAFQAGAHDDLVTCVGLATLDPARDEIDMLDRDIAEALQTYLG